MQEFSSFDNTTDIDLSHLQIYRKLDDVIIEEEEPCLVHSLKMCGVPKEKIDALKSRIPGLLH